MTPGKDLVTIGKDRKKEKIRGKLVKKILFSLMTMVLVMDMAGAGAFAYFSDTETSSGNTFTAGTLDLTVTGGNLTAPPEGHAWWTPVTNQEAVFFTLTNIAPGDSGTITYIVHNVGSLDGFLDLSGITIVDTVASDQEGLGVLASGKTYHIEARHHQFIDGVPVQFPSRTFRYTMPEKGPGELTIELRRGGRITGVVMSPNGSPVAGASVLVRAREVDRDEAAPPRILKTNRAGVFRSEPFSVGKWGLTISHPQLGTITTETIVAEGKTQSLGRLLFPRR